MPLERMQRNKQPHPTDPFAFEIAQHLQCARGAFSSDNELQAALRLYLQRAAEYSTAQYQFNSAIEAWRALELLWSACAANVALSDCRCALANG